MHFPDFPPRGWWGNPTLATHYQGRFKPERDTTPGWKLQSAAEARVSGRAQTAAASERQQAADDARKVADWNRSHPWARMNSSPR